MSKTPDLNPEQFKELFEGMVHAMHEGQAHNNALFYEKLKGDLSPDTFKSPEDFNHLVNYQFNKFTRGMIAAMLPGALQSDDVRFLLTKYSYVEQHFQVLFNKYEGVFACADKSRTVADALFHYFLSSRPIVFDPTAAYTYHHPKVLFTTQDEVLSFYKGLKALYYGTPDLYFIEMLKVQEKLQNFNKKASAASTDIVPDEQ